MELSTLIEKAYALADLLFNSKKLSLTRNEINTFLADLSEDERSIIDKSITSIEKIQTNKTNPGGISFVGGKGVQKNLVSQDKKNIKDKLQELFKTNNNKKERNQEEQKVLDAFRKFLFDNQKNKNVLIDFKQNNRAGTKWQNIDGYKVEAHESKYHLSFRPIFTSYEIKKGFPSLEDIYQVRNYVQFSHYVFLVFYEEKLEKEVMENLQKNTGFDTGFDQKDDHIGVFITSDLVNFKEVKKPKINNPSQEIVDLFIDILLSDDHKKKLYELMHEYLAERLGNLLLNRKQNTK